eukprot:TRINITY_DN4007_c0_g1_i1.p2 TRINITY_DN4007_c0_g1~~TRINITY_DN4007_c0_g1_i1.p2  ORF type:complete len:339 (-),score=46.17 TRINITY_DN4007_c0_g1_i1:51-1067(-)
MDRSQLTPFDPQFKPTTAPYRSAIEKETAYWQRTAFLRNPFDSGLVRPALWSVYDPIAKKQVTSKEVGIHTSTRDPDDNVFRLGLRLLQWSVAGSIFGTSLGLLDLQSGRLAPFLPMRKYGFVSQTKVVRMSASVVLLGSTWMTTEFAVRKLTGQRNRFGDFQPVPKLAAAFATSGLYWFFRGGKTLPLAVFAPLSLFGWLLDYDTWCNSVAPEAMAQGMSESRKWLYVLRHMPLAAVAAEKEVRQVAPDPVHIPSGPNTFNFGFRWGESYVLNPVHFFQTRHHAAHGTIPAVQTEPVVLNQKPQVHHVTPNGLDRSKIPLPEGVSPPKHEWTTLNTW